MTVQSATSPSSTFAVESPHSGSTDEPFTVANDFTSLAQAWEWLGTESDEETDFVEDDRDVVHFPRDANNSFRDIALASLDNSKAEISQTDSARKSETEERWLVGDPLESEFG